MKKLPLVLTLIASAAFGQIQPEPTGVIETLPETYPAHWVLLQDGAFFNMTAGKVIVVDADSDHEGTRVKGMFNASFIAQFYQARTKPEFYISETYYTRGTRGERTDLLSVYDKRTLAPIGEVVIPAKRVTGMPLKYQLQVVDDEKIALVYNFTPATSVSVVDLVGREFLGEIATPGCSLIYPMAGRAFASLCTDGTMLGVQLDENGQQASTSRTEVFFDANNDPLMEKAAMIDGVAYFPSFLGRVVPVDLNGEEPVVHEAWSLVGDEAGGWRPGGIQSTETDAEGRLYVLMHPDGYEGSHKDPGTEIWVYDVGARRRVDRIALELPMLSIGMTRDENPLLIGLNVNLEVDVYDVASGEYQRTLSNTGAQTPFLVHGAR